jgi:protein-disulfide isomerase
VPDSLAFDSCSKSTRFDRQLAADSVAAGSVELRGTPTLIVDGQVISGVPDVSSLERLVRASLDRGR